MEKLEAKKYNRINKPFLEIILENISEGGFLFDNEGRNKWS